MIKILRFQDKMTDYFFAIWTAFSLFLTQIFSNDIIVELYLQITLVMMKNDASIRSDAVFGREIRMQIIKEIIQYLALDRKQNVYK